MSKNLTQILVLCCFAFTTINAQKVDYKSSYFSHPMPATMPQLSGIKTYDFTFRNEIENFWGEKSKEVVKFKPTFGNFEQVDSSSELHVVSNLYYLKVKKKENRDVFDIDIHTTVANKYGTKLYEKRITDKDIPCNSEGNSRFACVQRAISVSLSSFSNAINGYKAQIDIHLARLDDVKKKSELYAFEEQVAVLRKALEREGVPAFLKAAEAYVPFWEKMTNFSEKGNADEVKRAAYQNLAIYYILSKNIEKAQAIIEQYKKIDKEEKEMFGLIKYTCSIDCEKMINELSPEPIEINETEGGSVVLSKEAIVDRMIYRTIEGTVTIKDKKIGGKHTGFIKLKSTAPTKASGNMISLDSEDLDMLIIEKNAKGGMDTLRTFVSKITEMQGKDGKNYIAKKLTEEGVLSIGAPGFYALMMTTYQSPKIEVYRCIVPSSNSSDYVMRKTTDEKGIKSGLFNNFKRMTEYFSDCPTLSTKMKAGEIDKKTSAEKMAEMYSNCGGSK
jgi:tetratricopeptide (TPR) repeat protein